MRRLSLRTHRIALGAMLSALAAVLACTGDDPLLVGPGAGDAGGPTSDSGGDATGGGDSSTDGSAGGCPGGQTKCGATCIPTDSDRANCGWCGHDCGAATCAGGKCAITSVTNTGGKLGYSATLLPTKKYGLGTATTLTLTAKCN